MLIERIVAIPSNRVNVSYNNITKLKSVTVKETESQSPQIGSMFPTDKAFECPLSLRSVAIPSNRVNVSYIKKVIAYRCFINDRIESQSPQIGSMFPTAPIFFYAL